MLTIVLKNNKRRVRERERERFGGRERGEREIELGRKREIIRGRREIK